MKHLSLLAPSIILAFIGLALPFRAQGSESHGNRATVVVLTTNPADRDAGLTLRVRTQPSPPGKEWDVYLAWRKCSITGKTDEKACTLYNENLRAIRVFDQIEVYQQCSSGLGVDGGVHGGCGPWSVSRFAVVKKSGRTR